MKQGRETWACWETAERLRKPESGTEAGLTAMPRMGLAQGMSSKGKETFGSWSGRQVGRPGVSEERQEGPVAYEDEPLLSSEGDR